MTLCSFSQKSYFFQCGSAKLYENVRKSIMIRFWIYNMQKVRCVFNIQYCETNQVILYSVYIHNSNTIGRFQKKKKKFVFFRSRTFQFFRFFSMIWITINYTCILWQVMKQNMFSTPDKKKKTFVFWKYMENILPELVVFIRVFVS